jgi:hypothetical protein
MTIEVTTVSLFERGEIREYAKKNPISIDRLDAMVWNIDVESDKCDRLTDFLDHHNIAWRLV